jgi:4-diphosphocytidyl-2-C-methyl-D-erythritol kinase
MDGPLTDTAFAKLNLALHVRRRRDDGYHEIETLFAFLDNGDRLRVQAADGLSLSVEGPFADDLSTGADNLVLRAGALLQELAGIHQGAAFLLTKRLPIASGIGGGSADAAAALRLAAQLWGLAADDPRLMAVAGQVGADVPACLLSQTALGTGLGDELVPVSPDGVLGAHVLLVNPMVSCPTGPVFAAWDKVDRGALDISAWRRSRNDLQEAAISLCPEIVEVLTVLKAQLPSVARMSGSGATCFGLFSSAALRDAAAQRIAANHPDWWLMSGTLR